MNRPKLTLLLLTGVPALWLGLSEARAQGVGINTDGTSPDASAILDVKSSDKGLLVPRVSLTATNSASPITSPATGLLVYNTNASVSGGSGTGFYYWDGSQWVRLDPSNSGDWRLTGNAGTSPTNNFLGTTDATDLSIRTNATERIRVTSSGTVRLNSYTTNNVVKTSGGDGTLTVGAVNLASSEVTGVLPVANGGTGVNSIPANGVMLGNGTSPITTVAPGAAGNVLMSNGTTWTSTSSSGQFILNQNATDQTANFRITGTGRANTSFESPVYTRADAGTVAIRPNTNSTTAIQLQNAGGTSILNLDAVNNRVGIGLTNPGHVLHVTETGSTGAVAGIQVDETNAGQAVVINESGTGAGLLINASDDGGGIVSTVSASVTNSVVGHQFIDARQTTTAGIDKIAVDIQSTGTWTGNANNALNVIASGGNTNVGINVTVSGGTTRYAGLFNGGNVGIGTTTPAHVLHVVETADNGSIHGVYINESNAGQALVIDEVGNGAGILLTANDNGAAISSTVQGAVTAAAQGHIFSDTRTSSTASIAKTAVAISSTGTWNGAGAVNRGLTVDVSGGATNYAALFNGGNVGIGTTSPVYALETRGPDGTFIGVSGNMPAGDGTQGLVGVAWRNASDDGRFIAYLSDPDGGYGVTPRSWELWEYPSNLGTGTCCRPRFQIYSSHGAANPGQVIIDAAGNFGINTTPAHRLHVAGNARVEGYLLVGNPATPSALPSNTLMSFYSTGDEGFSGWQRESICGSNLADWAFYYNGSIADNCYARYDNQGSRSFKNIYTPWIWIPTGSTSVRPYAHFGISLEQSYDGVFLEYSTNGSTWTKVTSFVSGGYTTMNANAMTNNACNAQQSEPAWTGGTLGTTNWILAQPSALPIAGNWVRFRFVAKEDASNGTGVCDIFRFIIEGNAPSAVGGSFAAGNIYAQNNVYAGSNVLLGDLAEYFQVSGNTEPGDLIAIDPVLPDHYVVAKGKSNGQVIGIHSENPTLTLNNPNSGVPVALRGRVPVKVCTQNGPIRIGDLLTVSDKAGHAMKATGKCYVIGRALENFEGPGEGKILCLVEGAWYNPSESTADISSGSALIPRGQKSFTILDSRFHAKSKAFITFTGEGGSPYWIAKDKPGQFTIRLAQAPETDLPFDYLIEYGGPAPVSENSTPSQTGDEVSYTRPEDFETGGWQYDPVKNVYWRPGKEEVPPGWRFEPFPEDTQPLPPPVPPRPEWPCYYIPGQGYKYSKDVQRLMRMAEESEKAQR